MTAQKTDKVKKNWWGRNWKWLVPTIVTIVILELLGFIVSIMLLMKSSGAYKEAMTEVRASSEVQEALGTPIDDKFFFTGNVNVSSGGNGDGDFTIRVKGPEDSAKVYVEAIKFRGDWHFQLLEVKTKAGQTIDLSDPPKIIDRWQ